MPEPMKFQTRSAKAAERGEDVPELIPFEIEGVHFSDPDRVWVETFHALPFAPSGVLDDLSRSVSQDQRGRVAFHRTSVVQFFEGVLVEEDVQRFQDLVHDKDRIVELEDLAAIMAELQKAITGVPLPRRSSSTNGRGRGPSTSVATA